MSEVILTVLLRDAAGLDDAIQIPLSKERVTNFLNAYLSKSANDIVVQAGEGIFVFPRDNIAGIAANAATYAGPTESVDAVDSGSEE
jgi:hypothetical protein